MLFCLLSQLFHHGLSRNHETLERDIIKKNYHSRVRQARKKRFVVLCFVFVYDLFNYFCTEVRRDLQEKNQHL